MNIDSIQNGVVLDHIQAGKSMDTVSYTHLDVYKRQLPVPVVSGWTPPAAPSVS